MSQLLTDILRWLGSGLRKLVRTARRMSPIPVLVRIALFVAVLSGNALAWPAPVTLGRGGLLLVGVAVLPALGPRSWMVTAAILVAVTGWLVATTAYGEPLAVWRLIVVAGLLYVAHSLAALAAVLPYDAVVSSDVLVRWAARTALMVGAGAVAGVAVAVVAGLVSGGRSVAFSILGIVVMAGLAGCLILPAWRRE